MQTIADAAPQKLFSFFFLTTPLILILLWTGSNSHFRDGDAPSLHSSFFLGGSGISRRSRCLGPCISALHFTWYLIALVLGNWGNGGLVAIWHLGTPTFASGAGTRFCALLPFYSSMLWLFFIPGNDKGTANTMGTGPGGQVWEMGKLNWPALRLWV